MSYNSVSGNKAFAKIAQYSTAGYATTADSTVVADSGGRLWFFGCGMGVCNVTTAKVEEN